MVKQYTRKSCSPSCLMKIDLCKAYDTMDWQFIKMMQIALNFPSCFIYIVMLNGSPTPIFQAKRGLWQGDPLFPQLFVISKKYLLRILKIFEDQYGFHPRCRKKRLTHLCFTDDLMLFCKGDVPSVCTLQQCIQTFSKASGLHANASKSAMYTIWITLETKKAIGELTQFPFGAFTSGI